MTPPTPTTLMPNVFEQLEGKRLNPNQKVTLAQLLLRSTHQLWRTRGTPLSEKQQQLLRHAVGYVREWRLELPTNAADARARATQQLLLAVEMLASARLGELAAAGSRWATITGLNKNYTTKRRPKRARGVMGAVQELGGEYLSWEKPWQTPRDAQVWRDRRAFAMSVQLGSASPLEKARAVCVIIASHLAMPTADQAEHLRHWTNIYRQLASRHEKLRGQRAQTKLVEQCDTLWTQQDVVQAQRAVAEKTKISTRQLLATLAGELSGEMETK